MLSGLLGTDAAYAQDAVVGRMGEVSITASALRRAVENEMADALQHPEPSVQTLEQLLRTVLIRRTLAAEARANGIDKRPVVIASMDDARDQVLVAAYINDIARAAPDYPADEEVDAFYRSNTALFTAPARYHVAQIFLAAPAADAAKTEEARKKAEVIARQARQRPHEFGALAHENSDHPASAATGGDLSWLAENQILPEMRTALAGAAANSVIGPVHTPQGWHIVRLLELQPPSVKPLSDVRASIVAALRYRKAQENERHHIEVLLAKTPITVNEAELSRLKDALAIRRD